MATGAAKRMWQILTWSDISREAAEAVINGAKHKKEDIAALCCLGDSQRERILLDLYFSAVEYSRCRQFNAKQFSTLFSILKALHEGSVKDQLIISHAFALLKQLLLVHSVERPPFSAEVFSLGDITDIAEWTLDTYFGHYKLYQYAFTDLVSLDILTRHVGDEIEKVSDLPSLSIAWTQAEYDAILFEKKLKEEEEEKRREKERQREEEEREREAERIRNELAKELSVEIREKIEETVKREIEALRLEFEQKNI